MIDRPGVTRWVTLSLLSLACVAGLVACNDGGADHRLRGFVRSGNAGGLAGYNVSLYASFVDRTDGWQPGRPGVELRHMQATAAPDRAAVPVVIVRLDPAQVRLRVAYAPDRPLGLRGWFEERRPLAALNGSFFTPKNQATALLVSDGSASGASYAGFGGMLSVAPDGGVSLHALRDQPYDPAEPIEQALQSFPMLVFPGGAPAAIEDDGRRARRSAVALDRAGRLLLLVSPTSDFTLRGLADWLSQSDLDVERALNLDGGSSTGLYLSDGGLQEAIDSFGPLPIVLLVEAK